MSFLDESMEIGLPAGNHRFCLNASGEVPPNLLYTEPLVSSPIKRYGNPPSLSSLSPKEAYLKLYTGLSVALEIVLA